MRRFLTRALGKNRLPIFSTSAVICAACLFFGFIDVAAQESPSGSAHQGVAAAQVLPETVDQSGAGSQATARPNHGVQIEGELEILQQDVKDGRSHLLYSLKQADGTRVRLQFVDEPPRHLLTGHHVRATGQLSGGSLILYSGGTTVANTTAATTTGPLPNTLGAQSTLVILVSFQDAASNQPWTPSQIQSEVFSGSGSSGFLQEASYGQT